MNKLHFSAENALNQCFLIPKPIIRYIYKNPKPSPNFLYKLYFSCKFFYPKIKIIGITSFNFLLNDRTIYWRGDHIVLPLNAIYKIDFKLCCIESSFNLAFDEAEDPYFFSYLLTKLWYFDNCYFYITKQILTVKEFKQLVAGSESICLNEVTVIDSDGNALPCEEILRLCPNVKKLSFFYYENKLVFTPRTAQLLSEIKKPQKLKFFRLSFIPHTFDPLSLSAFINENCERKSGILIDLDNDFTTEQARIFRKTVKKLTNKNRNIKIS